MHALAPSEVCGYWCNSLSPASHFSCITLNRLSLSRISFYFLRHEILILSLSHISSGGSDTTVVTWRRVSSFCRLILTTVSARAILGSKWYLRPENWKATHQGLCIKRIPAIVCGRCSQITQHVRVAISPYVSIHVRVRHRILLSVTLVHRCGTIVPHQRRCSQYLGVQHT